MYAMLLFDPGAAGAGRLFGLDVAVRDSALVKHDAWLRYILG